MSTINSDDLVEFVEKMPAFPKSVQRIILLTSDKNSTAKQIVEVIENDPVMTIKILKVINSAFYAMPAKVNSIHQAVIHLGLNTINNLALSVAAVGMLNNTKLATFNSQDFLLHSLTTGIIAKMLAERLHVALSDTSDFFVAGLLHDFGKIVFAEFVPNHFKLALEKSAQENISLHKSELFHIGMDHSLAGKLLAAKWQLSKTLIDSIDHHHHESDNILMNCVFAANQISKKMQFGYAGNPVIEVFPQSVNVQFGLSLEDLMIDLGDLSSVKSKAVSFIT